MSKTSGHVLLEKHWHDVCLHLTTAQSMAVACAGTGHCNCAISMVGARLRWLREHLLQGRAVMKAEAFYVSVGYEAPMAQGGIA